MQEVTITIDLATAETEVDLAGFHGKGCGAIVEGFAKAAGTTTAGMVKKQEFNAPSITKSTLKQR